jgi:hypothetical protein
MSFAKLPAINTNNRPFRTLAEGKVKPAKPRFARCRLGGLFGDLAELCCVRTKKRAARRVPDCQKSLLAGGVGDAIPHFQSNPATCASEWRKKCRLNQRHFNHTENRRQIPKGCRRPKTHRGARSRCLNNLQGLSPKKVRKGSHKRIWKRSAPRSRPARTGATPNAYSGISSRRKSPGRAYRRRPRLS